MKTGRVGGNGGKRPFAVYEWDTRRREYVDTRRTFQGKDPASAARKAASRGGVRMALVERTSGRDSRGSGPSMCALFFYMGNRIPEERVFQRGDRTIRTSSITKVLRWAKTECLGDELVDTLRRYPPPPVLPDTSSSSSSSRKSQSHQKRESRRYTDDRNDDDERPRSSTTRRSRTVASTGTRRSSGRGTRAQTNPKPKRTPVRKTALPVQRSSSHRSNRQRNHDSDRDDDDRADREERDSSGRRRRRH